MKKSKVRQSRKNWMGHVLSGNSLSWVDLEGKLDEKLYKGRRRINLLSELKEGYSYEVVNIRSSDQQK